MSLPASLGNFLRRRPRLFDLARCFDLRRSPSRTFFKDFSHSLRDRVSFVQIGANDGLRNDPIREFVVRREWRGILVEPLPDVFALLTQNYRHVDSGQMTFVNAAITSTDGEELTFWTFDEVYLNTLSAEERLSRLRKSSFDRDHLLRTLPPGNDPATSLKSIRVPCMTVNRLIQEHWDGSDIDLLVIDAEGHEPVILASMEFDQWSPRAIFFESHLLGSARETVFRHLEDQGYRMTELGGDTVAVRPA